jgi:hypothetical protein
LSFPIAVGAITQIPPGIVSSSYYGYNSGYHASLILNPKLAYWVKVNAPGKLVLFLPENTPRAEASSPAEENIEPISHLTVIDQLGQQQVLGLSSRAFREPMEVPPVPPAGAFDVRFATQQSGAVINESTSPAELLIRDAVYPVRLEWNIQGNERYDISVGGSQRSTLTGQGSLTIHDPSSILLQQASMPITFTLDQNYPNPFNPQTTLRYRIGEKGHVLLQIFDLAGREVATLVNEVREPGEYRATWDAGTRASGIYFTRLTAGKQTAARKMLLIR